MKPDVTLRKLFEEVADLSERKAADYNSDVGRDAYFPFGLLSYAQMLHTKSMRVVNLTKSCAPPNNESLEDSLKDIINYAAYALIYLRGSK